MEQSGVSAISQSISIPSMAIIDWENQTINLQGGHPFPDSPFETLVGKTCLVSWGQKIPRSHFISGWFQPITRRMGTLFHWWCGLRICIRCIVGTTKRMMKQLKKHLEYWPSGKLNPFYPFESFEVAIVLASIPCFLHVLPSMILWDGSEWANN